MQMRPLCGLIVLKFTSQKESQNSKNIGCNYALGLFIQTSVLETENIRLCVTNKKGYHGVIVHFY